MSLLADYAFTPDIFDTDSYSNEDVCRAYLDLIREPMLTEGLVRDLRKGEWRHLLEDKDRSWHPRSKEIIRKLSDQSRLIEFEPALPDRPADDQSWCAEALGTHQTIPFKAGVIATKSVKDAYPKERLVARIDRLSSAPWWATRSPSVTLSRTIEDYKDNLDLILRHSNSLLFIDPYLDPTKRRYRDFRELLVRAGNRVPAPLIEIHRVRYEGSGPNRKIFNETQLRDNFRHGLESHLRSSELEVTVFVWDDFHDRYLISNLIGILLPNGFDTARDSHTRWTRLGRSDRDSVQREFDEASNQHKLHNRFTIP
jgi:hypothetical protein